MADGKKIKYLTKSVTFSGKEITLFSLDGLTWSTRRSELLTIKERQERDRVSFAALKEEDGETRIIPRQKEEEVEVESEAFSNPDFGNAEVYEDDLRAERQKEIDAEGDTPPKRGRRPRMFPESKTSVAKPASKVVVAEKEVPEKTKVKDISAARKTAKNPGSANSSKGKVAHNTKKSKAKVAPKKRESSKPRANSKQVNKAGKAKAKKKAA